MSSIIDSLAKLAEKFSQKYPVEASGVATLDANARIPTDQAFSTGGSETHKAMGVIDSQHIAIGNTAVLNVFVDLMSYILPADTLDADGKAIRVTMFGSGNNSDTVSLLFSFGSTNITLESGVAILTWMAQVMIIRQGASLQTIGIMMLDDQLTEAFQEDTTEDETSSLVIRCQGKNTNDTSADAIVQNGMIVEILN